MQAVVEQFSYGPFATASFFFFMTLLDGGSVDDAKKEVQNKFIPTWKVLRFILNICSIFDLNFFYLQIAVFVWPFLQTINYCVIPGKNRLIFVSFAGLVWTTFLAFIKYDKHRSVPIANEKSNG